MKEFFLRRAILLGQELTNSTGLSALHARGHTHPLAQGGAMVLGEEGLVDAVDMENNS